MLMKAKLHTVNTILGDFGTTQTVEVSNVTDVDRVLKSAVQASRATLNDVVIVKNGYIRDYVYNNKQKLVDYLGGKIAEFDD